MLLAFPYFHAWRPINSLHCRCLAHVDAKTCWILAVLVLFLLSATFGAQYERINSSSSNSIAGVVPFVTMMSDLEVVRRTRGVQGGERRRYVNPQPQAKLAAAILGDGKARGRRRLRTSGEAVGTKEPEDGDLEELTERVADLNTAGEGSGGEDDAMSVRTAGSPESEGGDRRKFPEEQKPLAEVIQNVADSDAQDALERLRTRQLIMERRLISAEYLGQSHQEVISDIRVLVGPCMRIFPPKGTSGAWVRQQLTTAFWGGAFGRMVNRILSEYGIPFTFALVSHSCEQEVANICRQKVPYCWPMMYNTSKVGLQETQCHEARSYLKGAAERYAEQDQTEPYRFLYGYPMERRKINQDGKMSDDDDWSVEVIFPDTGEKSVLMVCLYDHEHCTQKYIVDARVLWDMTWVESDMESCIRQIVRMYKPCVDFVVEPEDPKLTIRGKRRYKEQIAKGQFGKGSNDGDELNVDRTNNGLGKSGGIPASMRGSLGGHIPKGNGKNTGKAGSGGASFGGPYKNGGKKGDGGTKGNFGKQQFTGLNMGPPIGVDGGFAPANGQQFGGGSPYQQQAQAFNPMELMQQFFAQAMGKGGSGKNFVS